MSQAVRQISALCVKFRIVWVGTSDASRTDTQPQWPIEDSSGEATATNSESTSATFEPNTTSNPTTSDTTSSDSTIEWKSPFYSGWKFELHAEMLAIGGAHMCALYTTGAVRCWGENASGQLGVGHTQNLGDDPGESLDSREFVDLGTLHFARKIVAGASHTCALLENGTVKCWGANDQGQLGLGDRHGRGDNPDEMSDALPAVDLGAERYAIELNAGAMHTCATLDNSAVKCWGANDKGQLGLGDTIDRGTQDGQMGDHLPALDLGQGYNVSALSLGRHHSCAILNDKFIKCWGDATYGQIGLAHAENRGDHRNEMGDRLPLVSLGYIKRIEEIRTGDDHTCILYNFIQVKYWGRNHVGQLGIGDLRDRGAQANDMGNNLPPVKASGASPPRGIALGHNHTCVRYEREVVCWGINDAGQLGTGNTTNLGSERGKTGSDLPGIDLGVRWSAFAPHIAAGGNQTCIVEPYFSKLHCWGSNASGQLGREDRNNLGDHPNELGDAFTSFSFGNTRTTAPLAIGLGHLCGIMENGLVSCWTAFGGNWEGQGGQGSDRHQCFEGCVVELGSGRRTQALSAGHRHTCALLDNGNVRCWSDNSKGQLGLGDVQHRGDQPNEMGDHLPTVNFGRGRRAQALAAGAWSTCALLDDGTIKCWGDNQFGQLGLGDTENRGDELGEMGDALPALNLDFGVKALSLQASFDSLCAVLSTGAVKCWGSNMDGALGLGDTENRGDELGEMGSALAPVDLGAVDTLESLVLGGTHACYISAQRQLKCWGNNASGQLGIGDYEARGDEPGEMGKSLIGPVFDLEKPVMALASGSQHTCALLSDHFVRCWGSNEFGQLGFYGSNSWKFNSVDATSPVVRFSSERRPLAISARAWFSCAHFDDGENECWGSLFNREIKDNSSM